MKVLVLGLARRCSMRVNPQNEKTRIVRFFVTFRFTLERSIKKKEIIIRKKKELSLLAQVRKKTEKMYWKKKKNKYKNILFSVRLYEQGRNEENGDAHMAARLTDMKDTRSYVDRWPNTVAAGCLIEPKLESPFLYSQVTAEKITRFTFHKSFFISRYEKYRAIQKKKNKKKKKNNN